MKVGLVCHGYPPELVGGTENSVRALAFGLLRRGVEVFVVAGSMDHAAGFRTSEAEDTDPQSGRTLKVFRIHRADLYFDHWQKSSSARVTGAFRELLRRERPDVVHVHHWIRLSRDLVAAAAREGIAACVTLHDFWASCLITFRVRPDTEAPCSELLGPNPCLACAKQVPPRTPWVSPESQMLALHQRSGDLRRELELARAVLVPSQSHADTMTRFLALDRDRLAIRVIPNGRDLRLARVTPPPGPGSGPGPGPDAPLVLGAWGVLFPLKGLDLVLEAIGRLREPRRVRLEVAGADTSEAYRARLRELARDLNVHFHPPFAAEELDRIPASQVHAMVSGTRARETWGLVLDEAVAMGLPMVLPRSGAFPERFAEGRGVLFFEPGDPASLAQVLERLLAQPALLKDLRNSLPSLADVCPSSAEQAARVHAIYAEVQAAGAPDIAPEDWWAERMRLEEERQWDAGLTAASAEELGLA